MINHTLIEGLGLNGKFQSLNTDDKLNFLLQTMVDSKTGICNGCGQLRHLVRHHWYEDYSFPLVEQERMVCESCNGILSRHQMEQLRFPVPHVSKEAKDSNPWVVSHILPSWENQIFFLQKYKRQNTFNPLLDNDNAITIPLRVPEPLYDKIKQLAAKTSIHYWCLTSLEQRANRKRRQ